MKLVMNLLRYIGIIIYYLPLEHISNTYQEQLPPTAKNMSEKFDDVATDEDSLRAKRLADNFVAGPIKPATDVSVTGKQLVSVDKNTSVSSLVDKFDGGGENDPAGTPHNNENKKKQRRLEVTMDVDGSNNPFKVLSAASLEDD